MTGARVLHLTTFLQGGAGRAIADLASTQRRLGHEVTVVACATGTAGYGNYAEYLDQLRDAGVTLRLCDSLFRRDLSLNLQVLEMLRHHLDSNSVDLIHAHAAVPALVGRLFAGHASRRIPVVQTQHGWGTSKTPAQAAADLAVLRDVDRVVVTSEATRDALVGHGVPAWSMTVIPCGLQARETGPPPTDATHLLKPLRDRGMRIVGCVGSVTENKNQQLLVEALSKMEHRDVVVVFIGEGGEALLPQAAAAGVGDRVIACGYQPHAARWLPMLDLLVLPSRTEGQGLAVLEAFRARVPVVASDIPALAQLVDDRRTGFLFQTDDAAALASAISVALTLPARDREAIVRGARARFLEAFTIDRMVERHEELYAQLASEALHVDQ